MGVVKGKNLRIYIGGNAIGYATSCSISMSAETLETISKDSAGNGWANNEVGNKSASLAFEGFFSEDTTINSNTVKSIEDLFTTFSADTAVSWTFTTNVSTERQLSGSGYITQLDETAPVDGNATYSGTITVDGAITQGSVT